METNAPPVVDPGALHLFYDPPGTLRLTAGNVSYPVVKLFQAAPLSRPGRHLSLVNAKGEEIAMVKSLQDFAPDARAVAEEEIRRRYLTAHVEAVTHVKVEFGVSYWDVETDRGPRDFVVQSLSESCVWLSDTHILLVDTDGNRFEIVDTAALDPLSRAQLEKAL